MQAGPVAASSCGWWVVAARWAEPSFTGPVSAYCGNLTPFVVGDWCEYGIVRRMKIFAVAVPVGRKRQAARRGAR
jgi:hypothetical protein